MHGNQQLGVGVYMAAEPGREGSASDRGGSYVSKGRAVTHNFLSLMRAFMFCGISVQICHLFNNDAEPLRANIAALPRDDRLQCLPNFGDD